MSWRERAACANTSIDWFPTEHDREAIDACRAICEPCPVRAECLDAALSVPPTNDPVGIYAGTTPTERRAIRRQRKETAA